MTSSDTPQDGANALPPGVVDAVLVPSATPDNAQEVEELDFNKLKARGGPITAEDLLQGMRHMGFQASAVGEAVRIINDMVGWTNKDFASTLGRPNNILESMARQRNRRRHDDISGLHVQPHIFRPARGAAMAGRAPTRVRDCHDRRWCRGGPHQVPAADVPGLLQHCGRGSAPARA